MSTSIERKIAQLPAKRRTRIRARAEQLIAEEISLQNLRKHAEQGLTRRHRD